MVAQPKLPNLGGSIKTFFAHPMPILSMCILRRRFGGRGWIMHTLSRCWHVEGERRKRGQSLFNNYYWSRRALRPVCLSSETVPSRWGCGRWGPSNTTSRSFSFPKGDDGTRINTLEKSALGEGDGYESNLDGANNVKWEHTCVVSHRHSF